MSFDKNPLEEFAKNAINDALKNIHPNLKMCDLPAFSISTYTCPNGHKITVRRSIEGKTHEVIGCLHEHCNMNALIGHAECDIHPTFEWYKPSSLKGLEKWELQDLEEGFLLLRPLKPVDKYIGRNDPCFCGSGKKYKHCCISKQ